MKIELTDIETIVYDNGNIKCKYVAKDGSVIKKVCIGYNLTEAKRTFKSYVNDNGLA